MTPAKFAASRAEQAVRYARKENTSLAIGASVFRVSVDLVNEAAVRLEKAERAATIAHTTSCTIWRASTQVGVDEIDAWKALRRLYPNDTRQPTNRLELG